MLITVQPSDKKSSVGKQAAQDNQLDSKENKLNLKKY